MPPGSPLLAAPHLDAYWDRYCDTQPPARRSAERYAGAFAFGFDEDDAREIARLVIAGVKTATGSLLWSYEADGKRVPVSGDRWIVTADAGEPACIIRTAAVEILAFEDVPEAYAVAGGEGDRSLAGWRKLYWRYILEECERIGRQPSSRCPLVMETIEVVYAGPA